MIVPAIRPLILDRCRIGLLAAPSARCYDAAPHHSVASVVRPRPDAQLEDQAAPMDLEIAVAARDVYGKQNKRLRTTGVVPGVLFGKSTGSIPVQIDAKALELLYHRAGRTSVVNVSVDGGRPTSAIIKGIQRNPLTGKALHVDLFAVDLTQEMQADIPLAFVGTSPAVELEGAILFSSLDHLKVRGLPGDLPHEIEVDLSLLVDLEATIHVRDLAVDARVTVVNDPDDLVAKVTPPRAEEEIAPVVAEAVEGAEGEAAAGAEGEAASESEGEPG
jgi:large subunit ribosomal protein L25